MITKEKLMSLLISGRHECYIKKSSDYNPYKKSVLYDWEFAIEIDGFIFTDAYIGFNPYSGVEYVFRTIYIKMEHYNIKRIFKEMRVLCCR